MEESRPGGGWRGGLTMPLSKKKNKVAMDAVVLDRYLKFLLGFGDKEIEIISRTAHFCKLPSNPDLPEVLDIEMKNVFPSCFAILDPEAGQRLKERVQELQQFHENPEECRLLAEAEEFGIEVFISANAQFREHLGPRAKGVALLSPGQYVAKYPAVARKSP